MIWIVLCVMAGFAIGYFFVKAIIDITNTKQAEKTHVESLQQRVENLERENLEKEKHADNGTNVPDGRQ